MTDSAHNVGLMPLLVDGIAHSLAINGKSLVVFTAMGLVPTFGFDNIKLTSKMGF
jgi:hypothetical protein